MRPDIKMQVQGTKLIDYDEVVKETYWAEESLKDMIALEQQRILALLPLDKGQSSTLQQYQ